MAGNEGFCGFLPSVNALAVRQARHYRDLVRSSGRRGEVRPARWAVSAHFLVMGLTGGVWMSRIPAAKAQAHLSDGILGIALFAVPAGLVLGSALAERLVDRVGSAPLVRIFGIGSCAAAVTPGLAAGPAVIGAVASRIGLHLALCIPLALAAWIAVAAPVLRTRQSGTDDRSLARSAQTYGPDRAPEPGRHTLCTWTTRTSWPGSAT